MRPKQFITAPGACQLFFSFTGLPLPAEGRAEGAHVAVADEHLYRGRARGGERQAKLGCLREPERGDLQTYHKILK